MLSNGRSINVVVLTTVFLLTITAVFKVNRRAQIHHGKTSEHSPAIAQASLILGTELHWKVAQGWLRIYRGYKRPLMPASHHGQPAQRSSVCMIPYKSKIACHRESHKHSPARQRPLVYISIYVWTDTNVIDLMACSTSTAQVIML